MKNSIGIIICLMLMFISVKLMAQDPLPKVQEFGIGLSNLNSYSMQYLWGSENRLSRLTLTLGILNSNSFEPKRFGRVNDTISIESKTSQTIPININGGLSYSILKIKPLTDNFGLVYGSIFSFSGSYVLSKTTEINQEFINGNPLNYTTTSTSKSSSSTLQPSIGLVIGAVYKISTAFLIYAEIDPHFYYQHTAAINDGGTNQYGNTYGLASLSNSGATLTLVYKITK
jgi:hypothetical protein